MKVHKSALFYSSLLIAIKHAYLSEIYISLKVIQLLSLSSLNLNDNCWHRRTRLPGFYNSENRAQITTVTCRILNSELTLSLLIFFNTKISVTNSTLSQRIPELE